MDEYKLFANMGYKGYPSGLRQLCIVVNERFGYVGITDEQWRELNELEKEAYTKPIDDLVPEATLKNRESNIAILKANRVNDVWVQHDGEKVTGFFLKPHSSCQKTEGQP